MKYSLRGDTMTTKKVAVKRKKTKKVVRKALLRAELSLPIEPLPILREALICAIDDPKRWGQPGTVAARYKHDLKAMNVIAEKAADLNRGDRCFFCDHKQPTTPAEDVYRFNPGISLCECLAPFRKVAFDYIENWETAEGKKHILAQVDGGKIALDTPVYQYFCQCGAGPVIVDVRTIAFGLRKHQKHSRRRLCNGCYQKVTLKRAQNRPVVEPMVARPKAGPTARINKIKHAKNKGAQIPPLPPLEALEKAPEAPATA